MIRSYEKVKLGKTRVSQSLSQWMQCCDEGAMPSPLTRTQIFLLLTSKAVPGDLRWRLVGLFVIRVMVHILQQSNSSPFMIFEDGSRNSWSASRADSELERKYQQKSCTE